MARQDATATLKERAYARLRRMIETGELPRAGRISNRKVAAQLGMSAIPVREAITQLVGEGLLEHRPGIGTYVVNPTRTEINDIYELREVLESFTARRAAAVRGERGLSEMRQSLVLMRRIQEQSERSDAPEVHHQLGEQSALADATFHLAILRRAGNQLALRTVTGLRLISRVFNRWSPAERMLGIHKVIGEHAAILDAIERHDTKEAGRLMRLHVRDGRRYALRHYDQHERDAASDNADTGLLDDLAARLDHFEGDDD